jgi:transcriptional regulator with XRE-family HTH domain
MAIVNNAIKAMEAAMTNEHIHRAHAVAEREILAIRLAELRERRGIKQTDIATFSQTAVSKLERRKDMKISTLIDYLESIGMGLELRVYPKDSQDSQNTETLLRV